LILPGGYLGLRIFELSLKGNEGVIGMRLKCSSVQGQIASNDKSET
jgi:hypothetical protein